MTSRKPVVLAPGGSHDEDDVFFGLPGTMGFLVADHWVDAEAGSFVLVPGGATHDFENRGAGTFRRSVVLDVLLKAT